LTATTPWDFLTGDAEKDSRNVRILLGAVEELYGLRTLEELMESAVDRAIQVTGAERGMLLLTDAAGVLKTRVARSSDRENLPLDTRYSGTVVNKVSTSGEASLTMDTADEHTGSLSDSILAMRLLSVMGVPLPIKGRSLGVLYVDSTAKVKEFTTSELSVFKALGGLIALAVENGRLLARKAEQERIKRELLVAQKIQERLLPTDLAQPEGFDLAGTNWPCDETSGDYFDVIPYGDGRLALVVGDVSGHGLGPALIMASTRALLHSSLVTRPDLADVVHTINVYLERDIPANAFMSFFLASLDPTKRTFEYVSAGHNPPLLRAADGTIQELGRTGPVLGVLPEAGYTVAGPHTLASGAVLMLYTDGIFEANDGHGEMYGEERLQASFAAHSEAGASATAILDGVLADLRAFVGAQPFDDDVTCLIVRVL
jgi:sigma-B regulation protein RsbU (phosphoserine phosphatase)